MPSRGQVSPRWVDVRNGQEKLGSAQSSPVDPATALAIWPRRRFRKRETALSEEPSSKRSPELHAKARKLGFCSLSQSWRPARAGRLSGGQPVRAW